MSAMLQIGILADLPAGVEALRSEAAASGFRFMDRFVTEWHAHTNRFDQPGEVLLGAHKGADLIAVGGLNRDPYTDQDRVGRLRHLYVLKSSRRDGVATALVQHILNQADGVFDAVRLRTQTEEAASFYVKLGFMWVGEKVASHIKILRQP